MVRVHYGTFREVFGTLIKSTNTVRTWFGNGSSYVRVFVGRWLAVARSPLWPNILREAPNHPSQAADRARERLAELHEAGIG